MNTSVFLAAIALAGVPAFPAPKVVEVTSQMVCAWGPITSNNRDAEIVVGTPAGPFTVHVGGGTKLVGLDGKELRGIGDLRPGANARVYYVVDGGARAKEIDLIPAAPESGATPP